MTGYEIINITPRGVEKDTLANAMLEKSGLYSPSHLSLKKDFFNVMTALLSVHKDLTSGELGYYAGTVQKKPRIGSIEMSEKTWNGENVYYFTLIDAKFPNNEQIGYIQPLSLEMIISQDILSRDAYSSLQFHPELGRKGMIDMIDFVTRKAKLHIEKWNGKSPYISPKHTYDGYVIGSTQTGLGIAIQEPKGRKLEQTITNDLALNSAALAGAHLFTKEYSKLENTTPYMDSLNRIKMHSKDESLVPTAFHVYENDSKITDRLVTSNGLFGFFRDTNEGIPFSNYRKALDNVIFTLKSNNIDASRGVYNSGEFVDLNVLYAIVDKTLSSSF